jgi:hypothetical protein
MSSVEGSFTDSQHDGDQPTRSGILSQAMQSSLPAFSLTASTSLPSNDPCLTNSAQPSSSAQRCDTPIQRTSNIQAKIPRSRSRTPMQAHVTRVDLAAALPITTTSQGPAQIPSTQHKVTYGGGNGYDTVTSASSGEASSSDGEADSEVTIKKSAGSVSVETLPVILLGSTALGPLRSGLTAAPLDRSKPRSGIDQIPESKATAI